MQFYNLPLNINIEIKKPGSTSYKHTHFFNNVQLYKCTIILLENTCTIAGKNLPFQNFIIANLAKYDWNGKKKRGKPDHGNDVASSFRATAESDFQRMQDRVISEHVTNKIYNDYNFTNEQNHDLFCTSLHLDYADEEELNIDNYPTLSP